MSIFNRNRTFKQNANATYLDFVSVLFWGVLTVVLAVIFNNVAMTTLKDVPFIANINENTGLMYSLFAVQATVSTLCFFISNVMTSVVSNIFYGLSIRDILAARTSWMEISFWHQSIVCILLILISAVFVIQNQVGAVFFLLVINLGFIMYMINSAFAYVFNYKTITRRVNKIVKKEIATGKTILDLRQLLYSLETDTYKKMISNDIKQVKQNLIFIANTNKELDKFNKLNELKLCERVIKKTGFNLIKTGNLELLEGYFLPTLEKTMKEKRYSEVVSYFLDCLVTSFMNYSSIQAIENPIKQHVLEWSKISHNLQTRKNNAQSILKYYNALMQNSRLNVDIKENLVDELFDLLTSPETLNQEDSFKNGIMLIIKKMILTNSTVEFKKLLAVLIKKEPDNSKYISEILVLTNIYCFYVGFSESVNSRIATNAREFVHLTPASIEETHKTLSTILRDSEAKYISIFWNIVKTSADLQLGEDLALIPTHKNYVDSLITKFYLIYWKIFANNLQNIDLKQSTSNFDFYDNIILNLTQNVKADEKIGYQNFQQFCAWHHIKYTKLKSTENWVTNADKIDDYISDVYTKNILGNIMDLHSNLNIKGTRKIENTIIASLQNSANKIPFNNMLQISTAANVNSMPFIVRIDNLTDEKELSSLIFNSSQELIKTANAQIRNLLLSTKNTFKYNSKKQNLNQITALLEELKINAHTHPLSNAIDVVNNDNDKEFIPLLAKREETFTDLSSFNLNEYVFLNTDGLNLAIKPYGVTFRALSEAELLQVLKSFESDNPKYKGLYEIEQSYGDKQKALQYYSSLFQIMDIKFYSQIDIDENCTFKIILQED